MASIPDKSRLVGTPARVLRFTASERAFHWLVAVAFFVMLITGVLMGNPRSFHNVVYTLHVATRAAKRPARGPRRKTTTTRSFPAGYDQRLPSIDRGGRRARPSRWRPRNQDPRGVIGVK